MKKERKQNGQTPSGSERGTEELKKSFIEFLKEETRRMQVIAAAFEELRSDRMGVIVCLN